jgi:hypothetical protein
MLSKSTARNVTAGTNDNFDVAAGSTARPTSPAYGGGSGNPVAPTFTLTFDCFSHIIISWNSVPDAMGYVIAQVVDGGWQQIAALGPRATSYCVTSVRPNTNYQFQVGAFNKFVNWAEPQTVTTGSAHVLPFKQCR